MNELRFAEPLPRTLEGEFVYIRCADSGCAQEIVAELPGRLMAPGSALLARRRVLARLSSSSFAKLLAGGLLGLATFFGLAAFTAPAGPARDALIGVSGACIGLASIVMMGRHVVLVLRSGHWLRHLPRVQLALVATPKGYRA